MIPALKLIHFDDFLDNSTLMLRELDPFVKHCIDASEDYERAILGYGKAMTDPYYLSLNLLYHADIIYESVDNINSSLTNGF